MNIKIKEFIYLNYNFIFIYKKLFIIFNLKINIIFIYIQSYV